MHVITQEPEVESGVTYSKKIYVDREGLAVGISIDEPENLDNYSGSFSVKVAEKLIAALQAVVSEIKNAKAA